MTPRPLLKAALALAFCGGLAAPASAGCANGETMGDGMVCKDGQWVSPTKTAAQPTSVRDEAPSTATRADPLAAPLQRDGAAAPGNGPASTQPQAPVRSFSSLVHGNELYSTLAGKQWAAHKGLFASLAHPGALPEGGADLMAPTVPCASHPAQKCYPKEQLDQIYKAIVNEQGPDGQKRWDDLGPLADKVLHAPSQPGDVNQHDLAAILHYLNQEQRGIDLVETLSGLKFEEVSKDPSILDKVLGQLPPDQGKLVDFLRNGLRDEMQQLIKEDNNFHPPLMSAHDTISERIMDHLKTDPTTPPIMSGGEYVAGDPKNPGAYSYAADEALRNGDPSGAASMAGKALELDPNNEQALSTLAAAKYDLKDMTGAAADANKALKLDPNDAQAQTVASLAHEAYGSHASIPSASDAHHDFADVPAGLAQAAPWRPVAITDEKERQAVAGARDSERALNRGDFSAAKDAADRALAADPHSAYAYGLKAFAEMKSGDAAGALRDAVAGLALNPADRMAQKARAQALLKLGRYGESLLAAQAAVSGDPRSGYARYLLAEAKAANGDLAGAREALKEAASLDLRYADMYKASLQSAALGDMAFLFPDLKPGALDAARAASAAAAGEGRAGRLAKIAGGAAVGGGLLAWLLWTLFGAALAPALKTVFTRRGPSVADPSAGPASGPEPAPPSLRDPSLLRGQYKTLRQIGVGGMGLVYEGNDVSLDRRVAIKKMRDELRLDRRSRERFVSEAKLVAALHHQNIVDIYSIVDERDELYLIFEYVAGKTLHELIHTKGPMALGEAVRVYRGVADALEFAHSRGIIHRDLKPSNIMLTEEGRPKVMDFGIARAAKDALTRYSMTNTVVGTPPYMAPEQEQGVVRKESDVYALAVCLYESLTGSLPFAGSGGGMIMNKINKAYTPASKLNTALPPALDEVLEKAFEPDPDKRYRSIGELRAALEALPVSAAA